MEKRFPSLSDELNATVITENDEFEVAVVEGEEMWSFVGNKVNGYGYTLATRRFI